MEEASKIFNYLPIRYKTTTEEEYIDYLWETFITNYESGKYQFAFLAYHMIFMCFVYYEIWQVKENCIDDFQKAMVGFNKDIEKELLNAKTPFIFWQVNESTVFRFFKLIGLNNDIIGKLANIVKEKNKLAHANGNIFYKDCESLKKKIEEILNCVLVIQLITENIVNNLYERFLQDSSNPYAREYIEDTDQVKEILIHNNYLSLKDIEILISFNIANFLNDPKYQNIKSLHDVLINIYNNDLDSA